MARIVVLTALLLQTLAGSTLAQQSEKSELHFPRYYSSRAENYIESNSWSAAKREIDHGLNHFPNDPQLRYLNGAYYYNAEGDLKKARYNLIKAIQLDDQNYQAKRLLVDIEDSTHHYSSAICYINELLEFQPYERDLWRRKISLYTKIGHHVEANAALERLARIYPNDSIVKKDLDNRHHASWTIALQKTDLSEIASEYESWITQNPNILEYYIHLTDTYRKLGDYTRAIETAIRGLEHFPRNNALVRQAAAIMTNMGLHTRALAFVKDQSGQGTLYNNILYETAQEARWRDPYEANGRLYLTTGDTETLYYLLNTAITRGYYDDARFYLKEAQKKAGGPTLELLLKEYALEKRFGNKQATLRLLEEISQYGPAPEYDEEYIHLMLELTNHNIEQHEWREALQNLEKALSRMTPYDETWPAAMASKITLLGHLNRLTEARQAYELARREAPEHSQRFAAAYEETASNRLRLLIEEERYDEALDEAQALLAIAPESEAALRACINMSQTLKRNDLISLYTEQGYALHPDVPYFIVKRAVALQQEGRAEEALSLLQPRNDSTNYVNPQLAAAYAGITEEWASLLLKEKMPELALEKIEQALLFEPDNHDLLYLKGLAYEQLKRYDLSYHYQRRYYNPSNAEQRDWYQQMRYLRYRSYRNHIDASYTRATYNTRQEDLASKGHLYSVATVAYSRLTEKSTWTGQVSYKGIDGYHNDNDNETGGIGLEFAGQCEHTFNHRWSGTASASWSTRYFNKIGANLAAAYAANHNWTLSLRAGYRLTPRTYLYLGPGSDKEAEYRKYHLIILTPAVAKSWERINTALSADLILLHRGLYYNIGWKGKIFVNEDNVSSVSLLAGFGSFPELNFFDQTALRSIAHTNAMVGFDAQYLITHNLGLGLTGTWNTCYNPARRGDGTLLASYRNIYTINLQLHVAF